LKNFNRILIKIFSDFYLIDQFMFFFVMLDPHPYVIIRAYRFFRLYIKIKDT